MKPQTVTIETEAEYEYMRSRGAEPLLGYCGSLAIDVIPTLRIYLQRKEFGHCELSKGNVPKGNERFYRWVWDKKAHYCEECLIPLQNYSATFVSHILSRSGHAEMAHDPRNTNILCGSCHHKWESRQANTMRVYNKNQKTIKTLRKEYKI